MFDFPYYVMDRKRCEVHKYVKLKFLPWKIQLRRATEEVERYEVAQQMSSFDQVLGV